MNLCELPDWVQYTTIGLAVFPHVLTFIPPQYQQTAGVLFKIANALAANYGHCKNVQQIMMSLSALSSGI